MRKTFFALMFSLFSIFSFAQDEDLDAYYAQLDSIEKSFFYEHGTISINNGLAQLVVPEGFKYLSPKQAEKVLVDLWGNPKSDNISLGMIIPENQSIIADSGYVFNIRYDELGYVKDDDADKIDYDDLLKDMKKEVAEESKERVKKGFESIQFIGWAAKPFYDKTKKVLYWAQEVKFGNSETNTLNYNVRVLGRKGILVLNAISTMPNLPLVQKNIDKVYNMVKFTEGNRYEDFNSSTDEVAAWTIGGLVAGKILAKAGFFALLVKFWKLIVLGFVGAFAFIRKKLGGNKSTEIEETSTPTENMNE